MDPSVQKTYIQSFLIHLTVGGLILLVSQFSTKPEVKKKIKFSVIEQPTQTEVNISSAPKEKNEKKPPKEENKVFGITKKSITSNKSTAPVTKQGNTIIKEVDDKKLKDGDPDELPIPKAEYMVTQMPSVKSQVKIHYPANAKKIKLEGVVVLSVLIDEKGTVRDARVIEGLIPEMDEEALRAIKGYVFNPAKIENSTVPVRIRYAIKFVLEDS